MTANQYADLLCGGTGWDISKLHSLWGARILAGVAYGAENLTAIGVREVLRTRVVWG